MKETYLEINNKTKGKPPRLPFLSMKDAILGTSYHLSLSFISSNEQRKLNKKYRNKDATTNILSFPYSKNEGEITLDLKKSKIDAPLFDMTYTTFIKYLFIHGCLHLKGYEHSSTMDKEEKKYMKKFK